MNVFMFGVVNVMHGFWVAGAIMVVLLGMLLVFGRRQRHAPGGL
jgi:Mg2+ and Co2+ transporter CorA